MPTGPVEEPSDTIYVPPTVAATVSIDTIDGLGQTATTFSGTVSTAAGGGYVELFARSVIPTSGQYSPALELGSEELFGQGSGEQTYDWSIANIDTASFGSGIYDFGAESTVSVTESTISRPFSFSRRFIRI